MPSITEVASQIEVDLDLWRAHMKAIGEGIPDFWDEQNASERLGDWLSACGYQKTGRNLIGRPCDVISAPLRTGADPVKNDDDWAINTFAVAMSAKMDSSRKKDRGGWKTASLMTLWQMFGIMEQTPPEIICLDCPENPTSPAGGVR